MSRGRVHPCSHIAFAALAFAMPVAMILANRATAAMLAMAASLLMISWSVAGRPNLSVCGKSTFTDVWVRHPFLILFLFFFAQAILSLPFTSMPLFHARRLVEFAIPVGVTALLLLLLRRVRLPTAYWVAVAGVTCTALLLLIELKGGAPLRRLFGIRAEDFRLNRAAVALLLMLFPLMALAMRDGRWKQGALACVLPCVAVVVSQSGSAVLGLLTGAVTLAVAHMAWRLTARVSAAIVILVILSAPFIGMLLYGMIPDGIHQQLASTSSAIRVDIWRAFGSAVQYAPVFGSGFNTAAQMAGEPALSVVRPEWHPLFEFKHAHNAALQIWVELGLVGALVALALCLLTLRRIDGASTVLRPAMLACFNASFAIAIVSHGAWQAWWAGLIGAVIVLFVAMQVERSPERV